MSYAEYKRQMENQGRQGQLPNIEKETRRFNFLPVIIVMIVMVAIGYFVIDMVRFEESYSTIEMSQLRRRLDVDKDQEALDRYVYFIENGRPLFNGLITKTIIAERYGIDLRSLHNVDSVSELKSLIQFKDPVSNAPITFERIEQIKADAGYGIASGPVANPKKAEKVNESKPQPQAPPMSEFEANLRIVIKDKARLEQVMDAGTIGALTLDELAAMLQLGDADTTSWYVSYYIANDVVPFDGDITIRLWAEYNGLDFQSIKSDFMSQRDSFLNFQDYVDFLINWTESHRPY